MSFVGEQKVLLNGTRQRPLNLTTTLKLFLLVLTTAAFTFVATLTYCSAPSTATTNSHIVRSTTASTNSHIARRPKTPLIYNNENLCSSTPANVHIHPRGTDKPTTATTTSVVIIVPSRRSNFMQRRLIRQTYGSIRYVNNVHILAVVFMLGSADAPNDEKTDSNELDSERSQFGDMIMGDFVDTYRSLSRKTVMAYDWLTSYCHEADLVVKTDDDVVVDIFKLTAELGKWTPAEFQSMKFWCGVHVRETIIRDPESIYYVSPAEYGGEKFPKHCAGVGYVTSMHLVRRFADEISKSFLGPICSHEDAFITGIVPEKLNSFGKEPSVEHINKISEWIHYVDEHNPSKDGGYIWMVADEPVNKVVDFEDFRLRSGTRIFYLLQHDADFERKFLRLWFLVEKSFRIAEGTAGTAIE